MTSPAIQEIFREAINAAIPDALLMPSEWVETYRSISQGPHRGEKYRMSTVPYLIEPLNCVADPRVRTIVFWSASRVAKTEGLLLNAEGYWMHYDPGPMLNLRPTLDDAKLFSRERWTAFIDHTAVLREVMEEPRTRDIENTLLFKKILGGYIGFAGANSPIGLIAHDYQRLCADEVDAYPINCGGYGDPLDLANVRLRNFDIEGLAQSILASSPTIKGKSRIETAYYSGDQRRLFVPCLGCGEMQELLWSSIKWTELKREPKDAAFVCPFCNHIGEEEEKPKMLVDWEWRAHAEFNGIASFKLLGTYSPFMTWGSMAKELTEATRAKSYEKYQVWCNSTLGELWEEGEGLDEEEVAFHQEEYKAQVPAGVVLLTFGADTHPDRIELEVLGWGLGDETWSIEYRVFYGDPNQYPSAIYEDVEDFLLTRWQHELGVDITITAGAIDTAGGCTDGVYKFCKANQSRRWWAIIGASRPGKPIAPKKPSIVGPVRTKLFTVGTEAAKDKAASALRVKSSHPKGKPEGGPGYCHFPITYEESYFKQFTAEHRIPSVHLGFHVWRWVTKRPGMRNEPWDCRVYNIFAKENLKPNLERLLERLLERVAAGEVEHKQQPAGAVGREKTDEYLREFVFPKGFKRCGNPICDRMSKDSVVYCCHGCTLAADGKYEIHESGLLGHSNLCNEREAKRPPLPPADPKPATRNSIPSSFRVPRRGRGFVKRW